MSKYIITFYNEADPPEDDVTYELEALTDAIKFAQNSK